MDLENEVDALKAQIENLDNNDEHDGLRKDLDEVNKQLKQSQQERNEAVEKIEDMQRAQLEIQKKATVNEELVKNLEQENEKLRDDAKFSSYGECSVLLSFSNS